ncbi:hypothetical protein [Algoriphagus zhangzhouensis]|uniref:Uncharacterized protein n=1 Tax=Algoriphagus zhangzhouensis TaxID=1073327 RepID=A0A1M7ZBJ6_9BACT|nr:hypothetical protein [Algoriphagus zhangzhouensis]TDY46787.1 hypothetical protein A8938_1236 [Algoriphagus zhangzhouensis]SHO62254.1 hypothetical protein SAMN04488108_2026 [Algoriphagus zhangzhouensis]
MRLKTLKVWLFLLPIIGIIGVFLFVQSNKNISELEEQHLRSVEAIRNDILLALPDYYSRVEGYILREAFAMDPDSTFQINASGIRDLLKGFEPDIQSIRFGTLDNPTTEKISLEGNRLTVSDLTLAIPVSTIQQINNLAFYEKFEAQSISFPETLIVTISFDIGLLLRKQENNKIFDKFFLTDQDGNVIYPNSDFGQEIFKPHVIRQDSVGKIHSGVYFEEVEYSGNQNRFYVAPIPLENLQLFAVGTINQNHFLKVGLRLNFKLLSTLIFFLILLIASVPILGILNLSKGDNLTQTKVLQLGISLMGLTLILGFAISFFKNQPDPVENSIAQQTQIEEDLNNKLVNYNSALSDWNNNEKVLLPFNEFILFESNGLAKTIIFKHDSLTFNFNKEKSPVDLRTRAYFTYFNSGTSGKNHFLNSHYSRGNGELESVISMLNKDGDVTAVTFGLNSLEKLKDQYRYLVIKEDGTILHKSDKITSPISNLKEGVNANSWVEIETLMKKNRDESQHKAIEVPLYLIGNHYTGVLSQISGQKFDQPIWLFFLVNHNVAHVFSSLTSLEAIILLAFYFLSLIFNLILQKFSKDLTTDFGFKIFFFDWLKPTKNNLHKLQYLSVAYFLFAGLLLAIYYLEKLNHIQLVATLVFSSSLISFINLATSKLSKKETEANQPLIPPYSLPTLVYSVLLGVIFVKYDLVSSITALILQFASALIILIWVLKVRGKDLVKNLIAPNQALPTFLISWFLVIGFIPGYLIQSKTQLFESQIWDGRNQIDDKLQTTRFKEYEEARRSLMVALTDPFDPKIKEFIAPDQKSFEAAWAGSAGNLRLDWNLLYLALILGLLASLIYYLQKIIFFSFEEEYEDDFESSEQLLYICSIDSSHLEEIVGKVFSQIDENLETIDFLIETLDWQFKLDETKDVYILKNYHCLADPLDSIPILERLHDLEKKIWICSGKQWKDIFSKIKDPLDKVRFSETFSDFSFKSLAIKNEPILKDTSEEKTEVLLKSLRHKKAFYTNMWTEMSFEEKMVAYAYAKEGFFNINRKEVMIGLAQKGILVQKSAEYEPKRKTKNDSSWKEWRLFSPVFRKYVLDHSTEEEKEAFKRYEKKNGNSNSIQISLISFVLICFALIGIFDKNFFSEAYTYLTGSLGLLGSLYALLDRGLGSLKFGKNSSNS